MGCSSHRHDNLYPLDWLLMLVVVLVTAWPVSAQSPSNNSNSSSSSGNNPYFANANFNPSMAIVIVVLISAFFFLGFFSIYIRQCAGDRRDTSVTARSARAAAAAAGRSRRQRGLDPDILASFPTLAYSDVRAHKIGKGFLECAVCLSEFEDDETLRLLPKCDHVFHPDCIDAWLAAHVTCPVCRCNLDEPAGPAEVVAQSPSQVPEPAPVQTQEEHQVVIEMRPEESTEEERMRKAEIENLERFVNMKRARSRARPPNFPRSHSTGHSLVLPGENLDRFTLRLPENIRRDLLQRAEMMKRTNSLVAFPTEGSSRRGYRGGEGSIGKGRSIRLGRSDRWGSFLLRTLSTKMPTWGRRGDGVDGSPSTRGGGAGIFRRGDSMKGEGSARGVTRFNAVVSPFDCYGGGAGAKEEDSQSSAAALNRV